MSSHTNHNVNIHDEENYDPTVWVPEVHSHGTKALWSRFWILLGLTIVDVAAYFIMAPSMLRNILFIVLGVVKAWFIVGTFMHMKYEKKSFRYMIILPMILIIFFLFWLMKEGSFWSTFK